MKAYVQYDFTNGSITALVEGLGVPACEYQIEAELDDDIQGKRVNLSTLELEDDPVYQQDQIRIQQEIAKLIEEL